MRARLFRYMSAEYAEGFVRHGKILFRALSYYRDYEDEGVRADPNEGTRVHLPVDGLKVTMVASGEIVSLPHTFESTAKEDDIFVYCLSTELSDCLAEKFNSDACVEILEPSRFLSQIRKTLVRYPSIKNKRVVHGEVNYYAPEDHPIVDWALPERIALSKPLTFKWQREYRIAFAVNGAFNVENVQVSLVAPGQLKSVRSSNHPSNRLKLGSLSNFCKIHRFS